MPRTTLRGSVLHGNKPNWEPLLHLVGEPVVRDFMWMFEVELTNGTRLQAYKHIDTRRYIHLDPDCQAFAYVEPDRYRVYPTAEILAEVFATLPVPGLGGVTPKRIVASWAAVRRAEDLTN